MSSVCNGHLEVVKYLIDTGHADINTKNNVRSDDMRIYNSIITITDMDVMIIYSMDGLH